MENKDNQAATMATNTTNQTPKVDEGTPARESKRTKLIQSEVEAAAAREAQDFYITRLTENYKQKLDMVEQGYEAQSREIQDIKSQLAASAKLKKEHQEQAREIQKLKAQLAASAKVANVCVVQERELRELKSQLATSAEKMREVCKTQESAASVISSLKSQLAATTERRREDQETQNTATAAAEDYKQRLDAMEQGRREQTKEIQDLKSKLNGWRLAASTNNNKTIVVATTKITDLKTELRETEGQLAESQKSTTALKTRLDETKWQLEENTKSWVAASDRALKAQWENTNLKRQYEAKLKEALEDEDGWMEIGFKRKRTNDKLSAPKFAVKRPSATFRQLARLALNCDPSPRAWTFVYEGRTMPASDLDKTLAEVSGVLCGRRRREQLTNY
jgi:chromosome segregation ATPase